MSRNLIVAALVLLFGLAADGQSKPYSAPPPDPRFKTDILLIVAHPDDDSMVSSYLARIIEQQHKRVSVVYLTRGNAGGNAVGLEQAKAFMPVRESEARHSLATLGITESWFLSGTDTAGADVLHSLESWGHGRALEDVVRLIRLTRPEVIFTWLPDYVVGENHEDHQASAVLAVEGFDLAADPVAFPEQITAPRNAMDINNYGEGLHPWQAKKIYFFSDTSHAENLKGRGPVYPSLDVSPARGISYARIAAEAWGAYQTQGDFDAPKLKQYTETPVQLILGKSLVGGGIADDVFTHIDSEPIAFAPLHGAQPEKSGLTFELGGPWAFYRTFWARHGLDQVASLLPASAQVTPTGKLWVPLLITNSTNQDKQISLSAHLPDGWVAANAVDAVLVRAHDSVTVNLTLTPPAGIAKGTWTDLAWQANSESKQLGEVKLHVAIEANGLPQ